VPAVIAIDARDAAVEPAGTTWDGLVRTLGLPRLWLADAISAYARGARQRVITVLALADGEPVALGCYRTMFGHRGGTRRAPGRGGRTPGRLWMCAPPVSFTRGLEFRPALTARERAAVREQMERGLGRMTSRGPHAIGYTNLAADELGTARVIVKMAPTWVLDVEWGSFDEFLVACSARRRRRFTRLLRDVAARPIARFALDSDGVDPAAFCRLELSTRRRHARVEAGAALAPAYVAAAARADDSGFFGYRARDGRLLQADLAFVARGQLVTTATAGEERDIAGGLYHAVMLDEIAWAIANGLTRLCVGPGATEDKRRFGCRMEEQYTAVHLQC
jgi:hypothetical protein